MTAKQTKRSLEAADWVDAAWKELGSHGVPGIRVEVLAKNLNVTKGSFYWHFRDRKALLDAVFQRWFDRFSIEGMSPDLERSESGSDRLWQLFKRVIGELSTSHSAVIRLWARNSPSLLKLLEAEHSKRMKFVTAEFQRLGFESDESRIRADMYLSLLMGEYIVAGGLPLQARLLRAREQVRVLTESRPAPGRVLRKGSERAGLVKPANPLRSRASARG